MESVTTSEVLTMHFTCKDFRKRLKFEGCLLRTIADYIMPFGVLLF